MRPRRRRRSRADERRGLEARLARPPSVYLHEARRRSCGRRASPRSRWPRRCRN
jgi:hypothetical protein